jgi:hypothetical protein
MKRSRALALAVAGLTALALIYACTGDDTTPNPATGTDGGPISQLDANPIQQVDTGNPQPQNDANPPPVDGGPSDCFSGTPTTYLEIINRCTDAMAVDKTVDLSKMNLADGGLKPLP